MKEKYDLSTPLYIKIENELRHAIDAGLLPPGSKLPTESELSDTHHVSRVTVRKALALLEEKGYIDRKVGKGTYVAEKKLKRNFSGNVSSFTLMCQETGMKATARTTRISLESPTDEQKKQMRLSSDQKILLIERIRYADAQPVMIERDYFTEDFDFLFAEDLNNNSLYELIRSRKKIIFTHASRTIDIVFANAGEARFLDLKTGYPLLRISSITENDSGQHVTLSEQLCIGDKFKLQV